MQNFYKIAVLDTRLNTLRTYLDTVIGVDNSRVYYTNNESELLQTSREEKPHVLLLDAAQCSAKLFSALHQLVPDAGIVLSGQIQLNRAADYARGIVDVIQSNEMSSSVLSRSLKLAFQHTHYMQQLSEANNRIDKSNKMKSMFLANLSHEVRTPLNAIVGFADLLSSDGNSAEEQEQYGQLIKDRSFLLLNMIEDVLEMSKIEADLLDIETITFDLNTLMEEIFDDFESKLYDTGRNDLKVHLRKPREVVEMHSDPVRLKQVMGKLLDNALKYTQKGSIEFGYEMDSFESIRFFVSDTGEGIEAEKHEVVFESFYKNNLPANFEQGAGLGLAICKRIVEKLNGHINLQSKREAGTTVSFTIPA